MHMRTCVLPCLANHGCNVELMHLMLELMHLMLELMHLMLQTLQNLLFCGL